MEDLKKQQAQLEGTFMTSFRSLWGLWELASRELRLIARELREY
jgi:hypothetical protein